MAPPLSATAPRSTASITPSARVDHAPSAPPPSPAARTTSSYHRDLFEQPLGDGPHTAAPSGPVTESTRISSTPWDFNGQQILRNLGQVGEGAHAMSRCAPSCELANAIANGRTSTDRYVLNLYQANGAHPERQAELSGIYQRLGHGDATYGDMHRLQELTYQTYERDGQPGFSPAETQSMRDHQASAVRHDTAADAIEGQRDVRPTGTGETPTLTRARIDALRPGQSFMMNIDGGGDGIRHAVTIGRDQQGHTYLYDPAPRAGDPTFQYDGERPETFQRYVDGSLGNGSMNLIVGGETQRDWPR